MTVDAPAATAHPVRFAQPVVAGLASAGVITITARQLFGYPQILPDVSATVITWLAPITAVLMLMTPAAAVAMRPSLGRAAGWPLVAVGLGVSTLVIRSGMVGSLGDGGLVWFLVVVAGFAAALSGVVVVAAQAPIAERVAIAAGFAFGFAAQQYNLSLITYEAYRGSLPRMLLYYVVIGLALVAVAMTFARPAPAAPQRGSSAVVPLLVAFAVASGVQLGHYLRQLIVDEFRVSRDGLASQRRIDTVAAFAEYSAIALAVVASLILLWLGYRRGKADLARWVVLGFALGGPGMVVVLGSFSSGAAGAPGHALVSLTGLLAAAAGVSLAWRADRLFPWDALGVAVTAFGMIISSVSYRVGPSSSLFATLLITGGFAFALAAGLTRVARGTTGSAGQVAVSLLLGVVALLVTADAIAPAAWLLVTSNGFDGFRLSVPITSLVGAGVLLLLFGFSRVVDRVRREIREQAAESSPE